MSKIGSELAQQRIGFLGAGAMAEALAGGLLAAGVDAGRIRAADPDPARRQRLQQKLGIATLPDNAAVVEQSDVVVLAVKPQVARRVLAELPRGEHLLRPLWISIAAGVRLARLEAQLPAGARIARAMPNTPALVRSGATAVCGNPHAGPGDLELARTLFESVGVCWVAPAEELLDAVTGLSGSGPAYVFVFIEALGDAGERVGLPREAARALAVQTVLGAAQLAFEDGRAPAELRAQVTSPGGTTLAGLERLEAAGFRDAVRAAVEAATRRSVELGQES
ncbi:MAG TPA: pyrroline-5-carboxylate reductase [Myxococcota bacterium]